MESQTLPKYLKFMLEEVRNNVAGRWGSGGDTAYYILEQGEKSLNSHLRLGGGGGGVMAGTLEGVAKPGRWWCATS